jgi:hypothetical protein
MDKPNGYLIWESALAVAIATGFERVSENRKTGEMIQIWLLTKHTHPVEAAQSGKDSAVCFSCPMRPSLGGGCYVNLGQAPAAIWRTYQAGGYPAMPSVDVFTGRMVRFGAYGDPTLIPLKLMRAIAAVSSGWTGYTHRWEIPLLAGYADFLMASADDVDCQIRARAAGWRTFRVAPAGSAFRLSDEISCPASKEAGVRVQCVQCRLCAGNAKRGAKSIVIQQH